MTKKLFGLIILLAAWLLYLGYPRFISPTTRSVADTPDQPAAAPASQALAAVNPVSPQADAPVTAPVAKIPVPGGSVPRIVSSSRYREALLHAAVVVDMRDSPRDARGHYRRVRLVKAPYKYPQLRIEATIARDPGTGREQELRDVIMVADHILVKLREEASLDDLHRLNEISGAVIRKALHSPGLYLVGFPQATLDLVPEQVRAYQSASSVVAYAEPDYIVFATARFPDDPRFSELYGLHNIGQTGGISDADVDAPEAWDLAVGDGTVVIGIIDSGIDYRHEDLAANAWINPGEIAGNGRDDDGNGFIDDVHGWDFANEDSDPFDDGDHGTHVAGTIAAVGDNGIGISGMSWHTRVMGLKFLLGSGFGSTSDAIDAVNYATMMRQRGIPIRLTNNSWGGGGFSQALEDAILAGAAEDILFVAAAGNDALDTDRFPHYPSSYDQDCILSVANTTERDELADLSNYGAISVDLSAPGSSILSTTPGNTYSVFSGTSMATPLVSGVAALMWSMDPQATYADVRDAILAGVDSAPALAGRVVTGGRLNAVRTLQQLGMRVTSSAPASGSVTGSPPTTFVIHFSDAYQPATLQPDDFTVNGLIPARVLSVASNVVRFAFDISPSTTQGLHAMAMGEDAVLRLDDGDGVGSWSGTFRYDALPLDVISIDPDDQSTVSLPLTTLRLQFNEPVDPGSVGVDDLVLSQGRVSDVALTAPDTIVYTLADLDQEGSFTVDLFAGALTDDFGNPCLAYTAAYELDFGELSAPAFRQVAPAGSLAYVAETSGSIASAVDRDRFTVELDAGQILTVVVHPHGGLAPALTVYDPDGNLLARASVGMADEPALVQGAPVTRAGTYSVQLAGIRGSVGSYEMRIELNTVREEEEFGGASNEIAAAAQDLDPVFTAVGPVTRTSLVGDPGIAGTGPPLLFAEIEPNDDGVVGGSIADLALANDWSGSFVLAETNRYQASLSGEISAGADADWDFFKILAAPGDTLEVSLRGLPSSSGTLDDPYLRLYDQTGTEIASNDDFGTLESFILHDSFPYTGDYYVVADSFGDSTGTYRLDAVILSSSLSPGVGPGDDWYRFSAEAGQSLSLVLVGQGGGAAPVMELYVGDGETRSAVSAILPDGGRAILDYPAEVAETHYVRISGLRPYHLVVTRDAAFGIGNQTIAQPLIHARYALGAVGPQQARFAIPVRAPSSLSISTSTPGDAPLLFENTLDPAVELYDPQGLLLAQDDNSAEDGRNAVLVSPIQAPGLHRVRLSSTLETAGEFLLEVEGESGDPPPFRVVDTVPGDGEVVGVEPEELILNLSGLLGPASVEAADLLVDGTPATSVALEDGDTLRFEFPALGHGLHTLTLASGAVVNVAGMPSEAFSMVLDVDLFAPQVISSSIQEDDLVVVGELLVTVGFSEALRPELLDAADLLLTGEHAGAVVPGSVTYDSTNFTLSVHYPHVADDLYTLTLLSQAGAFQDLAGHLLDGEPAVWPIPPNPSGDGTAGGDFVVHFAADTDNQPLPATWGVRPPAGALVHEATVTTHLGPAGDNDRFVLDLEAGQVLSVVVSPIAGVRPSLAVYDPTNGMIGAATASGPGLDVQLSAVPIEISGSYAVNLSAVGTATGPVDLSLLLNTSLEIEVHQGSTNDDPGSAEDLDVGRVTLSTGGVVRTAVTGSPAGAPTVPMLLAESEPNDDGVAGGSAADLPFANDWSGSFALTAPGRSFASVNGAILIGDDVDLDFFRLRAGPGDVLEINLYGESSGRGDLGDPYLRLFNDQGEEISSNDDGGEGLESFLSYGEFSYRGSYYVVADSFGSSIGRYVLTAEHTSLQQVNAESPGSDWYRFTATHGEEVSLALGMSIPGLLDMELFAESHHQLLASGVPAAHDTMTINGFVADETGGYLARVTGTGPYTLVLSRGAYFEREANDASVEAQVLPGTASVHAHLHGRGLGRLYGYDASAGDIVELSPGSGDVLNRFPSPISSSGHSSFGLATAEDTLLVAGAADQPIYALDPDSGAVVRTFPELGVNISGMAYLDGEIFLHASEFSGLIAVLDYADGSLLRVLTTQPAIPSGAIGASSDTLFGLSSNAVVSIDILTGQTSEQGMLDTSGQGMGVMGDELFVSSVARVDVYDLDTFAHKRVLVGPDDLVAVGADGGGGRDHDLFTVDVRQGDTLHIETHTPGDAPGALDNVLDPTLELFDPQGDPVAFDDNSGADGRNASLVHVADYDGWYRVKSATAADPGNRGEYLLKLSGATGAGPGMRVEETDPAGGDLLATAPSNVVITFSAGLNLATVEPGDLVVNGHPSPDLTVIDGQTIAFALPSLPGGVYPVWITQGAVTSLSGEPVEPAFFLFLVQGPRVINGSLQNEDIVAPGPLDVTVTFDRIMAEAGLDTSDLSLVGDWRGPVAPLSTVYETVSPTSSALHISFPMLQADAYTLTLFSGDHRFEDEAGNDLDGDSRGRPIPPGLSGNGVAGGDFILSFVVALPDADGDGLSDEWEIRHHLDPQDDGSVNPEHGADGDPDGDGATNEQEQAAGTDPRDPTSLFAVTAIAAGPGGITIQVSTQPGQHYTVQYSMGSAWLPFANSGNGIGTWMETNAHPTTFTFVDDFSGNSSGGATQMPRSYRVQSAPE